MGADRVGAQVEGASGRVQQVRVGVEVLGRHHELLHALGQPDDAFDGVRALAGPHRLTQLGVVRALVEGVMQHLTDVLADAAGDVLGPAPPIPNVPALEVSDVEDVAGVLGG